MAGARTIDAGKCVKLSAILRTAMQPMFGGGPDWRMAIGEIWRAPVDALR